MYGIPHICTNSKAKNTRQSSVTLLKEAYCHLPQRGGHDPVNKSIHPSCIYAGTRTVVWLYGLNCKSTLLWTNRCWVTHANQTLTHTLIGIYAGIHRLKKRFYTKPCVKEFAWRFQKLQEQTLFKKAVLFRLHVSAASSDPLTLNVSLLCSFHWPTCQPSWLVASHFSLVFFLCNLNPPHFL